MDLLDRAGVTRREREVLSHLGHRLTNAEIAERLVISVRTVESHVASLLAKLDATSRLELAALTETAQQIGFPSPLTSLIGREEDVAEIEDALAGTRLLTLSGVAGLGKTRLAIEAGTRLAATYRDGAGFVDLAAVPDGGMVASAVARTLGLPHREGSSGSRGDELIAHLRQQEALLVLDNCEHVLEPVAELVQQLLSQCARIKIIATSREAFGLAGETIFRVPTLPVPDATDSVETFPATQLLVERAKAVRPELRLAEDHGVEVADICQRLDGLPLAIELAAVQLAHLSPADVASRLDRRFQLLAGQGAAADKRWTSLRAAIDWSYEQLPEHERAVLARLAVFSGDFPLDAARDVCSSDGVPADVIEQLLGTLVWKSLVVPAHSPSGSRYRLLETIRSYGAELLEANGDADRTRAAHATWFAGMAEAAAPRLVQPDRAAWLTRLDEELLNVQGALAWAISTGEVSLASRLVVAMWRYWHMRGDLEEGRAWAARVVDLPDDDTQRRARTLEAAGGLAWWAGDMPDARDLYEEALSLQRDGGTLADLANALYNACLPVAWLGDLDTSLAYADQALDIYRGLDDEDGVAKAIWGWGACAYAGEQDELARGRFEEALASYQQLNDSFMLAWAHRMLGRCLLRMGERDAAKPHFDAGLALFDEADDVSGIILHMRDFAEIALENGDDERALQLVGAISALQETSHMDLIEGFSEQLDGLEASSDRLGEARTTALLRSGRSLSRRQALDLARSA